MPNLFPCQVKFQAVTRLLQLRITNLADWVLRPPMIGLTL